MMKFTIKIIQNNFYLKNQLLILFNDNGQLIYLISLYTVFPLFSPTLF